MNALAAIIQNADVIMECINGRVNLSPSLYIHMKKGTPITTKRPPLFSWCIGLGE